MTAFNVYNGDGSQTQFPITFDYFNVSEIEVLLWNSAVSKWQQKTNTVDYNIASTNINFVAAPAAPTSGITGNVLILRKTEVGTTTLTDAQAVYSPGSAINAADLNKNQIQALRAVLDLRDSNMPIHGKTWADSSQETRLYSDLNMTGREIKNVKKIKFESFAFTEGGVEVETDTKDIPTQAELALKDDITSVDAKLAFKDDITSVDAKLAVNVTNEDAKLALKDDITSVNTKLALNVSNEDAKLALKDDITSVDAKLASNVTNEDAKLALKDDITSVNTKLALNVTNEDAKLATKADLVSGKVPVSQIPNIAVTEYKGTVANQAAMLTITGEKGDWIARTDTGKVYVITGTDPTLISDWTSLAYPTGFSGVYADLTGKPTLGTAAATAVTDYATAAQGTLADSATQPGDLDAVATSGSYFDLSGLPTLGTAAATDSTAYATSTQGAKADSAVQPIDLSVVASSGDYSDLTNKPNLALKADLVGSVLDTNQVPELAITKFCGVVANENDMLALGIPGLPGLPGLPGGGGETGPPPGPGFIPEYGDWCSRSDNDKVYIVTGPDATLASDWTAITYPAAPVTSVAGRTGVVTLSTSDVLGLGTAATTASTDYATAAQGTKADSATQPADLAVVQADVDQNEADADTAIAAVQADVDQNETDADTAIAAVQADVDQNETDGDAADAALSGRITTLETDATTATAVAAVQADVDQNEADSDAAELALSNRLNTLEADPTTATAVAAVQADVDLNEANLASVATSGDYSDLSGKPSIPTIDPDTVIDANYVATENNFTNADHTKLNGIAAGAEVNVVSSVASKTGAVTLVKGDVGLGNVDNTSDANKPVSTATQTALDAKADLVAGKLNTSQLPDIAIAEYKGNVSNQTAMLAITGEKGDWVIRNDDSKVYVITGTNASVASDWTALSYPSAGFSGAYNDLSGKPTLGTAAATASTDYATAAQGTLADSATQPGDLATVATSGSYNDLSAKPTIPTNNNQLTNGAGYVTSNTQLSNEQVQDIVGGMVSGNSESGITVTYQDSDGTLDFSVASQTDQNFTNADHSKLNGIETGATADQSAAEIRTLIKTVDGSGSGIDADSVDGYHGTSLLRSDANDSFSGALTSTARNNGIFGTYDSTKTDHIWGMGTSYKNSSTGANFGNLYGLAYKHTNNSTGGTMGGGHQMVWCNSGTPRGAIGYDYVWHTSGMRVGSNTVWHAGNDGSGSGLDADLLDGYQLETGGRNDNADRVVKTDSNGYLLAGWINTTSGDNSSAIPNRMYCSDDGYLRYVDLASFRSLMNKTAKTGYQGREQSTSDTNYWVGTMGWGSNDFNTVMHYGSGHIEGWGSPPNRPSTQTSHWVGHQSLHYTNGSNAYGHQFLVGAGNPAYCYLRGVWGAGYTSWAKMWNTSNHGSGSGLDADLLDGQHGSYYTNYNNLSNKPTIPTNNNQLTNGASYLTSGTLPVASQAEAEAGTNNSKMMTPLRVAQAINAVGGSVINSIQRGTFQVGNVMVQGGWTTAYVPANFGPISQSITSVNTGKAMLNHLGTSNGEAYINLTSGTNIQAYRGTGTNGTSAHIIVSYEVIEFN